MDSDFEHARRHLKRARNCIRGNDKASREVAAMLDLLIIDMSTAEVSSLIATPCTIGFGKHLARSDM